MDGLLHVAAANPLPMLSGQIALILTSSPSCLNLLFSHDYCPRSLICRCKLRLYLVNSNEESSLCSVAGIVSEFDCAGSRGFARVCAGLRGFARVRAGSRWFARICAGLRGFARVRAGLRGFVRVCARSPGFVRFRPGSRWFVRV